MDDVKYEPLTSLEVKRFAGAIRVSQEALDAMYDSILRSYGLPAEIVGVTSPASYSGVVLNQGGK